MDIDLTPLIIISDDASLSSYGSISSLDISDIFGDDTATSNSSNTKASTTWRSCSDNHFTAANYQDSGTSTTDIMSRWGSSGSLCIDSAEEEQTPRCPQRQPSAGTDRHHSWSPATLRNDLNAAFGCIDGSDGTIDTNQRVTPRMKKNHRDAGNNNNSDNHISKGERLQFLLTRKNPRKNMRRLKPAGAASSDMKLHRMMARAKQVRGGGGPFKNKKAVEGKSTMTSETATLDGNTSSTKQQNVTANLRATKSAPRLPRRQQTGHGSTANAEDIEEQSMAPPKLPLRQKSHHSP